ncbi:MAG: T9SS type A sorting domain-containing protein [candidate division Zixibacteria bacterium]
MLQLAKHFTLLALFFLFGLFCAESQAGTVTVESINAYPGEEVVVPVYLSDNNIDIASMTVPLKYSSPDVYVDSISFVGSLVQPNMAALAHIDNCNQTVRFTYVPQSGIPLITASDGLLANIHFSVSASSLEQIVSIDSINSVEYFGELELWTRLELADSTGLNTYFPDFDEGSLAIFSPLDADEGFAGIPTVLELKQNYPNPFNPSTTISYSLPEQAHVSLKIYNILGQEIKTLIDETKPAGHHEIDWSSGTAASGIYFYRLAFEDKILTKKMTLLK